MWFWFITGLAIGWLIEWVIDWTYWRKVVVQHSTVSDFSLQQELEQAREQLVTFRERIQQLEGGTKNNKRQGNR